MLLNLLVKASISVPPELLETDELTAYAVHTRYPGRTEEVTEGEYKRAVQLAERVVQWVVPQITPVEPPVQPGT